MCVFFFFFKFYEEKGVFEVIKFFLEIWGKNKIGCCVNFIVIRFGR